MNDDNDNDSDVDGFAVKPVADAMTADDMLRWWPAILALEAAELGDDQLLAQLLRDKPTAKLLLAWRQSIVDLEAARARAEKQDLDTSLFNVDVHPADNP